MKKVFNILIILIASTFVFSQNTDSDYTNREQIDSSQEIVNIEKNLLEAITTPDTIKQRNKGFTIPFYLDSTEYNNLANDSLYSLLYIRSREIIGEYITERIPDMYNNRQILFLNNDQDTLLVGDQKVELLHTRYISEKYDLPISVFYRVFSPKYNLLNQDEIEENENDSKYLIEIGLVFSFNAIRVYI